MAFILAIQPDAEQAAALQRALRRLANVKIAVVDSKEAALRAIDHQVPDLILLYALMPPDDEEHLGACLAMLPDAGHVQTITIPYFDSSSSPDRSHSRRLWIGRSEPTFRSGCDPKMFASDVFQYLSCARTIRAEIEGRRLRERPPEEDRRRAPRWLSSEVPWVSSVRLATAQRVELLDISSNGALLRSYDRPRLVTRKYEGLGLDLGRRPELTLQLITGEEIRVAGRIVRYRADSTETGAPRYDVALRFDEAMDLFLPVPLMVAPETIDYDMRAIAVRVPHDGAAVIDQWGTW
jgi:CheY-like chemotaxis protein